MNTQTRTCIDPECERDFYSMDLCQKHYMRAYRVTRNNKDPMSMTKAQLWLLELERERYDTSWKIRNIPKPAEITTTPPQDRKREAQQQRAEQRKRDNVMFHAGRYSAGARDQSAVEASKKLKEYMKGK